MSDPEPVALITGASAGIGAALANVFADHGHTLVLAARRAPQLKALAEAIEERGHARPHVVIIDLGQPGAAARIEEELRARGLEAQFLVNVASVASFMPGPGMAVYHATKAYVLSFSEALHRELGGQGVRVTALCPGPVETEFIARAGIPENYFPRFLSRSAERVAQEGYDGLMRGQRVVIPGSKNKGVAWLARLLPLRVVLWMLR